MTQITRFVIKYEGKYLDRTGLGRCWVEDIWEATTWDEKPFWIKDHTPEYDIVMITVEYEECPWEQ